MVEKNLSRFSSAAQRGKPIREYLLPHADNAEATDYLNSVNIEKNKKLENPFGGIVALVRALSML